MRNKVFTQFGRKCNRCKVVICLNVHHKTYSNGKEPWEYPLNNFEILCDKCHAKEHKMEQRDAFCENPNCKTPSQPIRQCFKFCFACNQNLLGTIKIKTDEIDKLKALLVDEEETKGQVEELKKLNREKESLLREQIEAAYELKQKLEDTPNNDVEIARYDKLLFNYNAELEKSKVEIDGLKGEVGKDASMRLILISLVMVVIGLLCFSIFSDDVKNDPSPDPTVTPEPIVPPKGETFTLNNVDGFIGKFVKYESRVFETTLASDGIVYINLGGVFPNQLLTLVIFKRYRDLVGKLPQSGDIISYEGRVQEFKGKPQIVIESGAQFTVLGK